MERIKTRRGCQGFVIIEGNVGISLGADFTSEHELGITGIKRSFGLRNDDPKLFGFESRRNTLVPSKKESFPGYFTDEFFFFEKKESCGFVFNYSEKHLDCLLNNELCIYDWRDEHDELAGAWDEKSFGVHTLNAHKELVKDVFDALQTKNGIIMRGGRVSPLENQGLIIADLRKITKETQDKFFNADKTFKEEQKYFLERIS